MTNQKEGAELIQVERGLEVDESQSEESECTDDEPLSDSSSGSWRPVLVAGVALFTLSCMLFVTLATGSTGSGDVQARLGRLRGATGVPSGIVSASTSWSKSAAAAGGVMTAGLLKVSFGSIGHCCGVTFNAFAGCVASCWSGVMNCTGSLCGALSGFVATCWNAVGGCFGSLCSALTGCLKGFPLCGDALGGCSQGTGHCIGGICGAIGNCFASMWHGLSGCILGIMDKCAACVASVYNSFVGCVASIWGSLDRCCASSCSWFY